MADLPGPSSRKSSPESGKERHVSISPDPVVIPTPPRLSKQINRPSSVVSDGIDSNEKLKGPFQPPSDGEDLEMQQNDKDSVGADLVVVASKRARQFGHDAKMCVLEIIIVALLVIAIAFGVKFGFRSVNPNPDPS